FFYSTEAADTKINRAAARRDRPEGTLHRCGTARCSQPGGRGTVPWLLAGQRRPRSAAAARAQPGEARCQRGGANDPNLGQIADRYHPVTPRLPEPLPWLAGVLAVYLLLPFIAAIPQV